MAAYWATVVREAEGVEVLKLILTKIDADPAGEALVVTFDLPNSCECTREDKCE